MLDFKELFDYNLIHENKHPLFSTHSGLAQR